MVSPVLAQAILGQRPIDFVGQFQQGREERRAAQARTLSSELLQGQFQGGKIGELAGVDPTAALQLANALNIPTNDRARLEAFAKDTQIAFGRASAGDVNGAVQFVRNRRDARRAQGVDTANMDDFLARAEQNPDSVLSNLKALNAGFVQAGVVKRLGASTKLQFGGQETFKDSEGNLFFGTSVRDPSGKPITSELTPIGDAPASPVGQVSLASKLGETAAETSVRKAAEAAAVAQAKADVEISTGEEAEEAKARGKARGKTKEEREQSFVTRGIEAADSTANVRRGIQLLEDVQTGGIDAVALRAKQIFGIESGDEGELVGLLGKAVLSQLRETFGAQFTVEEVKRLERIEARFTKSPAANKRLLQNVLKSLDRISRRGIKAAKDRGDTFGVQEIETALKFDLAAPQAAPRAPSQPSAPQDLSTLSDAELQALLNGSTQ